MKRILSMILAASIVAALFSACGTQGDAGANPASASELPTQPATQAAPEYDTAHTLYFRDDTKSEEVTATFFNSLSGASTSAAMQRIGEDGHSFTFSCEGDCSLYNMVRFQCGDRQTDAVAFNPCTSCWRLTEDDLLPCPFGGDYDYLAAYDHVRLSGYGYEKNLYIWKPDDYDPEAEEPYATIYMLDGQGMAYFGWEYQPLRGCPVVTAQVEAMTASTGQRAIVVCIESDVARGHELIPRFAVPELEQQYGSQEYDCMDGSQFADFVAHTAAPYVREHYNVYDDALHTAVSGGSFGGLEAFYMAVEYPDVFGAAGALSPSLFVFTDAQWREYLGKKRRDSGAPFLYIYTGGVYDTDRNGEVAAVVELLRELGYPEDKIAFHYYSEGTHSSLIWRNVFSEFLTAMFYRQVKPLQESSAATGRDRLPFSNKQ